MGVNTDKYFGYIMDVTNEYNNNDTVWDKYIDGEIDGEIDNLDLKEINFVPYYSSRRQQENDITLLYDGMNGKYAKLIFINTVEKSDDDFEPNEKVNESLKLVPVPIEVKEKLEKAYKIIFGESKECPIIHLMQFNHYH